MDTLFLGEVVLRPLTFLNNNLPLCQRNKPPTIDVRMADKISASYASYFWHICTFANLALWGQIETIAKSCNGPFAAERSRGTNSPKWRANDALGHVKQSHQIWIFFL